MPTPSTHFFEARSAPRGQRRAMTDGEGLPAQDAAQPALEQAQNIRLSPANQTCVIQALQSPPPRTPALDRAFLHRSQLFGVE